MKQLAVWIASPASAVMLAIPLLATPLSAGGTATPTPSADPATSFFVTSEGMGNGGNLGGLQGADRHCQALATRAGIGKRTWRAYLSTSGKSGAAPVNARDRIGMGPWVNARAQFIARNDLELHETAKTLRQISNAPRKDENNISADQALDEYGRKIAGGPGIAVLTGSQPDGTAYRVGRSMTCGDWTSTSEGVAQIGHLDRVGGGQHPASWNSAESTRSCGQEALAQAGAQAGEPAKSAGRLYCFAAR